MRLLGLALMGTTLLAATPAFASPTLQGSYGDWRVYARYDGAQKLCYVVSGAKSKSPSSVRHGDIYFLIANWKSGAAFEQPSFKADFPLKKDRPPKIRVGSETFPMYTSDNEAFVAERSDEVGLVRAMRAGSTLQVNAVSIRGTNVSYTFSLRGVTAALKKAQNSCA